MSDINGLVWSKREENLNKTWASIFVLLSVEQIIKIIIHNNYFETRFPIMSYFLL